MIGRSLFDVDRHATVPVVQIGLLRALPLFSPLPPDRLESVARSLVQVEVDTGTDTAQHDHAESEEGGAEHGDDGFVPEPPVRRQHREEECHQQTGAEGDSPLGLSAGAGLALQRYRLDYAFNSYADLGEVHRLANPGKVPLEIIEVQSGSYLGEDDIVRFEDNYGRSQK